MGDQRDIFSVANIIEPLDVQQAPVATSFGIVGVILERGVVTDVGLVDAAKPRADANPLRRLVYERPSGAEIAIEVPAEMNVVPGATIDVQSVTMPSGTVVAVAARDSHDGPWIGLRDSGGLMPLSRFERGYVVGVAGLGMIMLAQTIGALPKMSLAVSMTGWCAVAAGASLILWLGLRRRVDRKALQRLLALPDAGDVDRIGAAAEGRDGGEKSVVAPAAMTA
ncbi:hypothetical protein [Sphingomonas oleivorans]|uniref:hypothetical protein n=1 Tax=Sphingomonas oleivorans TaxID=1735121 RepID=UPI00105726F2|nr:hypothetical protein [Sphingomonas oleivorans]